MIQKIGKALIPALLGAVLFFAGCPHPLDSPKQTNSGEGTVLLSLANPSPRTLLPSAPASLSYAIEAVRDTETAKITIDGNWDGASAKSFTLSTGNWTITVTGYATEDETKIAISQGSGTVTIETGKQQTRLLSA